MSRLKGGSAGEPVRGFTLSYFHDNVKGIELQTKNTYGLRLLPAFQTNADGAITDLTSVMPYRDVDHLDPETSRPVFTEWYFPLKVHKMVGSGDRTFVSPLILEGRDCKDVDPLHNMYLAARNSENADWQRMTKKEDDEYNAVLGRYRVMYVANCIASIDNKIENRALVMPNATLIDLKRKLNLRAGRGDAMLDPNWPDYCFGDVTSVQHGLWATVKAGVFNDAGMKTSLFFFGTSAKDDQPIGIQQYPLVDAWGQAFLAGRYNIGDTEKVTKISTAEEILAYAVDDEDWPYELVQQACGHRWDVPACHRARRTFVAPVGAPPPVSAPPAPGMPPAPTPTPVAAPVLARKFWIVIMGEVKGPFPEIMVQSSVNLQGDIQVCLDGTQAWQPASVFGIRSTAPIAPATPAAPSAPVTPTIPPPPAAAPAAPTLAPPPPVAAPSAPPTPVGAPPRPSGPPPAPSAGAPPAPGGALPRPAGPPAPGMPPRPTPVQPPVASAPTAPPAGAAPPPPSGPVPQTSTQPLAQPAAAAVVPLNEAELTEAKNLLNQWTANSGSGGALLEPDKIARFSELSDRATAAGQSLA